MFSYQVLAMYAVLGVTFFAEKLPEYFGDFGSACFTLLQASTGDGWSDIVRQLWLADASHEPTTAVQRLLTAYFVTFIIIVTLILMQATFAYH
jgi:hypothetical protein